MNGTRQAMLVTAVAVAVSAGPQAAGQVWKELGPAPIENGSYTGRVSAEKRYADGLHQALEAKERLSVLSEGLSPARVYRPAESTERTRLRSSTSAR